MAMSEASPKSIWEESKRLGLSDVHTYAASRLFDTPMEKITDGMRRYAKSYMFAFIYEYRFNNPATPQPL